MRNTLTLGIALLVLGALPLRAQDETGQRATEGETELALTPEGVPTDPKALYFQLGMEELSRRFFGRMDTLLEKAEDPFVRCHLQSVKALARRSMAYSVDAPPAPLGELDDPIKSTRTHGGWFMNKALYLYTFPDDPDDARALAFIRNQGRFIVAFRSRIDHTVQHYVLTLPANYDPETTYPVIVDLHGAMGAAWDYMRIAGWFLGPKERPKHVQTSDNAPDKQPAEDALEPYVKIWPWGRGGYGYAGEVDIWDALADAKRRVKIDEDRQALTGSSLGGAQSWRIASRSPGYWCAYAFKDGAWGPERHWPWLHENVKQLPVLVYTKGTSERGAHSLKFNKAFWEELKASGKDAEFCYDPEGEKGGGKYVDRWLLSHVRTRPKQYSYTADRGAYQGPDGAIRITIDPTMDPRPSFTCRIEGRTVSIDSEGTPGLEVDLGPTGLGLSGDVTVIWNGKEVTKTTIDTTAVTRPEKGIPKRESPNIILLGKGYRARTPWERAGALPPQSLYRQIGKAPGPATASERHAGTV